MTAMVECRSLFHVYKSAQVEVVALQGLELEVAAGEAVAVIGRSGSGKTTLMNILAGVEQPTAGSVRVAGTELADLPDAGRVAYRREQVGYAWQDAAASLQPELSAFDNVQVPMLAAGVPRRERLVRAAEILDAVGVKQLAARRPPTMSAGEQARLALAAALVNRPRLLLSDEPTGQLDRGTARQLLADLRRLQHELGLTLIVVTHDAEVERYADRVVRIRDGRTSMETRRGSDEEELVVVDRAGRLQLPPALAERVAGGRVRVRELGGRIVIERVDGGANV